MQIPKKNKIVTLTELNNLIRFHEKWDIKDVLSTSPIPVKAFKSDG